MKKPKAACKLVPFDAARDLTDYAAIAEYLNAVLESDDRELLLLAFGDIARGMAQSQVGEGKPCPKSST